MSQLTSLPELKYHGSAGEYFPIFLKNLIFTFLTLGIYSAWAVNNNRKYFVSQFTFSGARFNYHGNGMELFKGRLIALIMMVIVFVVGAFLFSSIESDGFTLEKLMWLVLLMLGFFALIPIAIIGMVRYRLSRTSLSGIRFSLDAEVVPFIKMYFKGAILSTLTLGLYCPIMLNQMLDYILNRCSYGNKKFSYNGESSDLFWIYLKFVLFFIPTLGLYYFWYKANFYEYVAGHTKLDGYRFDCDADAIDFMVLIIPNILIVVFTAGLGTPIAVTRVMEFMAEYMAMEPGFSVEDTVRGYVDMGDAIGEGLGASFDLGL